MTIYILLNVLRMHAPVTHMPVSESRKGKELSDGNVAMFGQQSVQKEKAKVVRDLTDVTCYGCGKKAHLRRSCPTKGDEKAKNEKPATQREESSSKIEATTAKKPPLGNALRNCRRRHSTHQRTHWLFLFCFRIVRSSHSVEWRCARLQRIRAGC